MTNYINSLTKQRKTLVKSIVGMYTNKMVCASMADKIALEERETKAANKYLLAKMQEFNIDTDEVKWAIQELESEAKEQGKPFCYDLSIL